MALAPTVCRYESVAEVTEISKGAGFLSAPDLCSLPAPMSTSTASLFRLPQSHLLADLCLWLVAKAAFPYVCTYIYTISTASTISMLTATVRTRTSFRDDRVGPADDSNDTLSTVLVCYLRLFINTTP